MENASNALMIAAGVLIGILLVSLIVISFNGAADLAKSYDSRISASSLQAFNSNFEKYTDGEVDIQSIITMTHFAKDYNSKNELKKGDSIYISVICEGETGKIVALDEKTDDELLAFMQENTFAKDEAGNEDKTIFQKYKCQKIEYNENTGTVTKITFKKVK